MSNDGSVKKQDSSGDFEITGGVKTLRIHHIDDFTVVANGVTVDTRKPESTTTDKIRTIEMQLDSESIAKMIGKKNKGLVVFAFDSPGDG